MIVSDECGLTKDSGKVVSYQGVAVQSTEYGYA